MIKSLKQITSLPYRQLGMAMSEYIPIVILISSVSMLGYAKYGHVARGHGGQISTELAGESADFTTQDYADSNYYSRNGLGSASRPGSTDSNPAPTNPAPTNPAPTNPAPTNPAPTNPAPTNPAPTNPAPTNPAPTNPAPTNPAPTNPAPTNPAPNDPGIAGTVKDFFVGVVKGLIKQGKGLWDMASNPWKAATDIYALGEALLTDFPGTMVAIKEALGADADKLLNGTAEERGQVLGEYISPVALVKVLQKLTKLGKVVGGTKKPKTGCSSFAAGTKVWTPNGLVAIETVGVGSTLLSRNDETYLDSTQAVIKLMGRTVDYYYHVSTGYDEIDVTEEHPFWLQGRGWVEARDLIPGNVVAAAHGDLLIQKVTKINNPLQVYNFSVANTHTYFVSKNKLWVHNANITCGLVRPLSVLLVNGKIPGRKTFNKWYDQLSLAELQLIRADKKLLKSLGSRIRNGGGKHEWYRVSQIAKFKKWGVSMNEIHRLTTPTLNLVFTNPKTGIKGAHNVLDAAGKSIPGPGSKSFDNALKKMIGSANSIAEYNAGLAKFVSDWRIDPSLIPPLTVI